MKECKYLLLTDKTKENRQLGYLKDDSHGLDGSHQVCAVSLKTIKL